MLAWIRVCRNRVLCLLELGRFGRHKQLVYRLAIHALQVIQPEVVLLAITSLIDNQGLNAH